MFVNALLLLLTCIALNNGHAKITTTTFEGIPDNWSSSSDADPFAKVGNKFYMVENKILTDWFDAGQICRTKNAHLASIDSDAEADALFSYIHSKDLKEKYWISGNDLNVEGEFIWFGTGKPLTISRWAKDQPDNLAGNENCIYLEAAGETFLMNDRYCKEKAHFICEAKKPQTIAFTVW